MSKQHHFVVFWDTKTQRWEIGHAVFEEDEPIYDTETEEWHAPKTKEDNDLDDKLAFDLHERLSR